MVTKEEFEILKLLGKESKGKNIWLKVYDDEKGKEGYIKLSEVIENLIDDTFEAIKETAKELTKQSKDKIK